MIRFIHYQIGSYECRKLVCELHLSVHLQNILNEGQVYLPHDATTLNTRCWIFWLLFLFFRLENANSSMQYSMNFLQEFFCRLCISIISNVYMRCKGQATKLFTVIHHIFVFRENFPHQNSHLKVFTGAAQ